MRNLTYLLMFFSFVYSQCNYSNESDCIQNQNCEWSHNYQTMNCSNFGNSTSCENYAEYGCSWEFSWGGWQNYGSSCVGGTFQVDNGSCQEVEMPDCSELDQNLCNHPTYGEGCQWIANIESGYCPEFNNSYSSCSAIDDCNWTSYQQECTGGAPSDCPEEGCGYSWLEYQCTGSYTVSYCGGGYYEIDNGYCEETMEYQMGDVNQDDNLDILDIVIVVDAIINGGVYIAEADMNSDGSLNILDAVSMVGIILDS